MKKNSLYTLFLLLFAFLLAPFALRSQIFEKVSAGHLTSTASGSRSCNFLDFNNDGFQDVLITNGKSGGENNMLYVGGGNGTFTLLNDTVCSDNTPSDGATCGDFDNDGWIDIYTVNWYGVNNLLYHNAAGLNFEKIDTAVVPNDGGYSETAAWGDMDADGLLDLYVTNSAGGNHNFLYHNQGGGAFTKVTGITPVTDQFASRSVNWIDYDRDGDQDLFVANESTQRNQLYRNDGLLNFTKVTTGDLVTSNFSSHSSSWVDYDNDGDFDVLIANYNQANQLFQNDGSGNFSLVANAFGADVGCSFSSSFADYDNDGDLDLFVTNGYCTSYTQNFLYENDGNGNFIRDSIEPMALDSGSSYGCAWGDYDNDGFMDLVVANWRNETDPNSLYHNTGNGNHWFQLKLTGTISNRSAIGTIIRCKAIINGNPVWQMHEISAQSGYCSQNMLVAHFGLGNASQIDSLEVIWPSGIVQIFENITVDERLTLIEQGMLTHSTLPKPGTEMKGLKAFPNPSEGALKLEFESKANMMVEVQILNMMGKAVFEKQLEAISGKNSLPITMSVPAGVYQIRVVTANGESMQQKLVVKH